VLGEKNPPFFAADERASEVGSIFVLIMREPSGSILVQIEYHILNQAEFIEFRDVYFLIVRASAPY
jgi:hypothetical protein